MVTKHTEYLMGLIGGIITFVVGIIATIFGALWVSIFEKVGVFLGIWGMGCGILIIIGAYIFKKEKKTKVGILLMLIFGIAGLITLQGWIIGPVLAIIAAVLALVKR
jgi:hypothetical protein